MRFNLSLSKLLVLATIVGGNLVVFSAFAPQAYGCNSGLSRLDPTCRGRIFGPPAEDSGACLQSITPATYYDFQMRNSTNNTVYYSINGTQYNLSPGYQRNHHIQRTSGSSSSCGSISTYNSTVTWDYSYADGYQGTSFTLPVSNYDDWYEFYIDDYGELSLY